MTVNQAKVVLQYRPVFGDHNQIAARDLLRLVAFLEEQYGAKWNPRELDPMTREEIDELVDSLGYTPREVIENEL